MPTNNPQGGLRRHALRALLFVALLAPSGGNAAETTAQKREAARQKIAAMTEAERARLKVDFEKFSKLSDEEREKLRRLDRELQADPELQRTKKEYLEFLEPLSAGEREDLHREADLDRRAAMVRKMMKEHQDRAESWIRRGINRRSLSPADLDKVLGVVEEHLRKERLRTKEELDELQTKQGLARQVAILDLALPRPMGGERAWPPFFPHPSQPLLDEMVAAISDPEQRQRAGKGGSPERVRNNLFVMIDSGIWAEFESIKPTEEMLGVFLAKLNGTEQGEILRLPPDQRERTLLRKYAEAHPEQFPKPPRRWMMFGGERGSRRFGPGRYSDGENLRGPGRPDAGSDGNFVPPPDRRRDRPPVRPKPEKSVN